MKAVLGIKKGMTRVFRDEKAVPVTILDVQDCVVSGKDAKGVELGIRTPKSSPNKALSGKYSKLGYVPRVRVWVSGMGDLDVNDKIDISDWEEGTIVDIEGRSKGKGFAGVVKRWGFKGGPKTHGQSDKHRSPGSIGSGTTPGRVWKGKKMAGRMGGQNLTVANKKVVEIRDGYLLISGSVPGARGDVVLVKVKEKVNGN
ncbi:50S ribosomal protein L3 [Candidatus Dojkabacteria bacterium]|uniref:50S ribosomal protein L3 n=1 Tax=Candidatus Dojkabacteria bacterium TaxID=2099670 RepID=A0A955HZ87_9BACT|nr:50S ribosomal protein L3 [Candidatus Dojkabacteria bacterium]MCB9790809.1 50S ribosomal protein L3 [Candidatus Nomurabacteria bacterium]